MKVDREKIISIMLYVFTVPILGFFGYIYFKINQPEGTDFFWALGFIVFVIVFGTGFMLFGMKVKKQYGGGSSKTTYASPPPRNLNPSGTANPAQLRQQPLQPAANINDMIGTHKDKKK